MIGQDRIHELLRTALEHSKADQTEARISAGKWALTRFAKSSIHQNMASSNALINVRAVFGKKVASASSNRIDEQGIRELVDSVVEMARLQDENPDFVSLPEPIEIKPTAEAYCASTADSSPEDRAKMVRSIAAESDGVGGHAAGSVMIKVYEHAVMNSLGIDSYYRGTSSELVTVVTGPDGGFGYASAMSKDVSEIDAAAIGREAAERAHESRHPADMEPGEYECILMPYAVADVVGFFVWMGFGALAYQEKRSFICVKLGERIVDERVTIWDDAYDPATIVTTYDAEGVAKQRVDLVRDGVANGLLYDSYTAHREGKKSTGHASGYNLLMGPGDASVDNMIASTKRGLLVTRFHYTNVAHLMSASITGMTRDGTFLIENGKITGPVKNLRFTQSILEALSNVEMIGRDRKLCEGAFVPGIKVRKFRFSSATEF